MMTTRILAAAAFLLFAALLTACSPPPPGVHERLIVSEQGEYRLNGQVVARDQLQPTLAAERQKHPALFAEISASPRAQMEAVQHAVSALKAAQVRFAFVDENIMDTTRQKGAPAE